MGRDQRRKLVNLAEILPSILLGYYDRSSGKVLQRIRLPLDYPIYGFTGVVSYVTG